jgi:enoyl-CoA hydratase/carnithine racemase
MLELMMHCHYLVASDTSSLGMPEVTLPVIPGMEGCHWPFRKSRPEDRPKILNLLLTGKAIPAADAVGWLVDYAGPMDDAIQMVWKIASGSDGSPLPRRKVTEKPLDGIPSQTGLPDAGNPAVESARKAVLDCIRDSCGSPVAEALDVQARHSAGFMSSKLCRGGVIGAACAKTMNV